MLIKIKYIMTLNTPLSQHPNFGSIVLGDEDAFSRASHSNNSRRLNHRRCDEHSNRGRSLWKQGLNIVWRFDAAKHLPPHPASSVLLLH